MIDPVKRVIVFLGWTGILFLSVYFFLDNVVAYFFGYRSPIFGNSFFYNQIWVVTHLAGGTLTLFLGPIQFWKYIRMRYVRFHRMAGKLYIVGILLAGGSAIRLSMISSCVPCRISLFILAVLALMTTALAWIAIRNRSLESHRQFMVRSYICVLAFVAVRIDDVYSLSFLFGEIDDSLLRRVVNEYFFSFVPLLIAEIMLTWLPSLTVLKSGFASKIDSSTA